jgi:hypothetical protein
MIINPYIVGNGIDANAQAFITAAGLTNLTQINAVNNLVIGLKSASLWTKMNAIYPFVGGTATTHKFNLKNPLDTNAAFRLFFSGGWTHSANGAKGSTNGWADTFLSPSTHLSLTSGHISYYSRLQVQQTGDNVMGSATGAGSENIITMSVSRTTTNTSTGTYTSQSAGSFTTLVNASTLGLYTTTRTGLAASTLKLFRNATVGSAATANGVGILPTTTMAINCLNYAAGQTAYSSKEVAFVSIGSGLSDTDVSNLYTIVQAYQTALSRNV